MTRKHAARGASVIVGLGFVGLVVLGYLFGEAATTGRYAVRDDR